MAKILLTNIVFAERTGTEVVTFELAHALRRRGHFTAIFSPTLGLIAHEARASGIPVAGAIDKVGFTPDVIHGQHNIALLIAMMRFRHAPAVFVCHDSSSVYDQPLIHSRIKRFVAVDAACRERLIFEGVSPGQIDVIPNGVASGVYSRRAAWPEKPRKALLVVKQKIDHVPLVEEACRACGIELEVVGPGVNRLVADLSARYLEADIVFAHSRSAIEAAFTGAAVIIIDEYGYGGLLRAEEVVGWPETTLSRRLLSRRTTVGQLSADIMAYSAEDARMVCDLIRERTDLERITEKWEEVYDRAMAASSGATPNDEDDTNLSAFLQKCLPERFNVAYLEQMGRRDFSRIEIADRLAELFHYFNEGAPDEVLFHRGAIGQAMLDSGWYVPEDELTWSGGGIVSLWLPHALVKAWEGRIVVKCSRYISKRQPADAAVVVGIQVDGRPLREWTFGRDDGSLELGRQLVLPEELRPKEGEAVKLSFEIRDAISPLEGGDGLDQRVLGLSLLSLCRAPAPERSFQDS